MNQIIFRLDNQRHALPMEAVERVFHMIEITPAPQAHPMIAGIIDVQGRIIPVVNTRRLMGLPAREAELSDQLILVKTSRGSAALWVDGGTEIRGEMPQVVAAQAQIPVQLSSANEVFQTNEGLVFVHDVELLLGFLKEAGVEGGFAKAIE